MASASTKLRLQAQQMAGPYPTLGSYAYAGGAEKAKQMWSSKVAQNLSRLQPAAIGGTGGGLAPGVSGAFQKAMEYYAPEGGYGAGIEAGLERGRIKSLASGGQSLVSAGLAGTTMMAGLGKKYEEEVAAPTRVGVESARAERLSSLQLGLAQTMQGAFESAEERALRERLTGAQISGSLAGAAMSRYRPPAQMPTQMPAPRAAVPRQTIQTMQTPSLFGETSGTEEPTVSRGFGPMFERPEDVFSEMGYEKYPGGVRPITR